MRAWNPRRWTRAQWLPWVIVIAAGALAQLLNVPVAWLVGPMLASVTLSLRGLPPGPNPPSVFTAVQAIIGTALIASFSTEALQPLATYWFPISVAVVMVLVVSVIAGVVLHRIAAIDPATASLGTVPGGASSMVAMSEALGADTRLVAFMQYARVLIVILAISLFARVIDHDPVVATALHEPGDTPLLVGYGLAVAVAVVGAWLGIRFRLPAGALIGPLLVGMLPPILGLGQIALPVFVLPIAYLLLGARIGSRFDRAIVQQIWKLLPFALGFVVALSVICAGLGWALASVTDIDLLTAILATSPGGLDAATIAALDTGANVPIVLAVQILRLLLMVIAGPWIVRRLVARNV